MDRLARLREILREKGREEALLLLVDTLLSDMTVAATKDGARAVNLVIGEYNRAKVGLLEAATSDPGREKVVSPPSISSVTF